MNILIASLVVLGVIAAVSAVILFFVAKKFAVHEDPRIDQVEEALPGANCGGCGFAGCRNMAESLVKSQDLSTHYCPVGGAETMACIAKILGLETVKTDKKVATLLCNGTCEARPKTTTYIGVKSCSVANLLYAGETGCKFGCIGFGDCVEACQFDAIHLNPETGIPEVDANKCTACGACTQACPKGLLELRKVAAKNRQVFVACKNEEKGAVARKACKNACIGCGKCAKECPFGAITIENNVAYIDDSKCRLCKKCVAVCPTGAIHALNFPEKKIVVNENVQ